MTQTNGQVSFARLIREGGTLTMTASSHTGFRIDLPMSSKRVILRLQERDFPDIVPSEIFACVEALLLFMSRPAEEALERRHFWQFTGKTHSRLHIVIDIDIAGHSGPIRGEFPHEIYRVMRIQDEM